MNLIGLLELILYNNVFRFNDTFYLQLQGTAMGTEVAPSYGTIGIQSTSVIIPSALDFSDQDIFEDYTACLHQTSKFKTVKITLGYM